MCQGGKRPHAMPDEANPHKVELEAYGRDIPRLRELLKDIDLSADLTRFRIEIESEEPIFPQESPDEPSDSPSETPKEKPEAPENGDSPGTRVMSHRTEADENGLEPFPRGTNEWKVVSFLYRQNEPLKLGHIHEYLEDTPLEVGYKSLSATLSSLKERNLVEVTNPKTGGPSKYRLTGKGEAKVAKTQDQAEEYILTVADKVAGLHPTSSFDPPELSE